MLLNCGAGGLLRVPWFAKRSNQSILQEIIPEYSLEGLMWSWNSNTLSTWCEELTHLKRPWCWERLRAGGEGDDRGWDGWIGSLIDGHEFEQAPGVGDRQGGLACCSPGVANSRTRLRDWTELGFRHWENVQDKEIQQSQKETRTPVFLESYSQWMLKLLYSQFMDKPDEIWS